MTPCAPGDHSRSGSASSLLSQVWREIEMDFLPSHHPVASQSILERRRAVDRPSLPPGGVGGLPRPR